MNECFWEGFQRARRDICFVTHHSVSPKDKKILPATETKIINIQILRHLIPRRIGVKALKSYHIQRI